MSTADSPARRRNPLWPLLGVLLIAAAASLLANAAFEVSRGPSECGGDAPSCPEGFIFGLLGGVVSVFVIAPIGIALLAGTLRNAVLIALTLAFGGLAAGCYVSGFAADPVSDSSVGQAIGTGVFGLLALLTLWPALRMADPQRSERLRAAVAEADQQKTATRAAKAAADAPRAYASGSIKLGDAPAVKISGSPTLGDLHALLGHGLANGGLATNGAQRTTDPDDRARVAHLIDLHRRGTLDDEDLLNAMQALRDARAGGTNGRS